MLKPKSTIPNTTIIWGLVALLLIAGVVALIFAFRSPRIAQDEVNAIYTNAAMTLEAHQLTLQAAEPTATATFTMTPTETPTLFATITLPAQPVIGSPATSGGSGAAGCDNSAYVADVTIPDGTVMAPGQSFTKTWKVQNNGTCAWTTAYQLTFVNGEVMGGRTTPIGSAVGAGQTVDVSVSMVAPTKEGEAIGYWKIFNDKGQPFGTFLSVEIKVGTLTATASSGTPTATSPAATTAPSNTPETPTDVPPP